LQAAILQCTTPLYITQEKSTCKPPWKKIFTGQS
jgi:hypothetical protein